MSNEHPPREVPMSTTATTTAKEEVIEMLRHLPDDLTFEDIRYHITVLEKIKRGIESADTEPTITQEEMEAEFSRWFIE